MLSTIPKLLQSSVTAPRYSHISLHFVPKPLNQQYIPWSVRPSCIPVQHKLHTGQPVTGRLVKKFTVVNETRRLCSQDPEHQYRAAKNYTTLLLEAHNVNYSVSPSPSLPKKKVIQPGKNEVGNLGHYVRRNWGLKQVMYYCFVSGI
jgi:hypothetical protein